MSAMHEFFFLIVPGALLVEFAVAWNTKVHTRRKGDQVDSTGRIPREPLQMDMGFSPRRKHRR